MAISSPLRNPAEWSTQLLGLLETVFAVIFMVEFVVKLIALGGFLHEDSYWRSPWNWLDSIVVAVSIMDFFPSAGGGGALKTLRILRAFRPLRMISRNEGLKVVVKTIFAAIPDLATLAMVTSLLLLIFALFCLNFFNGRLMSCSDFGTFNQTELTPDYYQNTAPLCFNRLNGSSDLDKTFEIRGEALSFGPSATIERSYGAFANASCVGDQIPWRRATFDTPICIG